MMRSSRVAIIQSSYIPWRGYFAMIAACEAFIFLDSVQFTRRDWRTRNAIKGPSGPFWLSVPVKQKGNYHTAIDEIEISSLGWTSKHLSSIETSYRRGLCFELEFPALAEAYAAIANETSLSNINQGLTHSICRQLGIETRLFRDVDLLSRNRLTDMDPTERLVALAKATGAEQYLSGPSARSYLDESQFHSAGLTVAWMDYVPCLEPYRQLWGEFDAAVSIVDPLLNIGAAATRSTLLARASVD